MIRTGVWIASTSLASAVFARPPFQGTDIGRRVASAPDGLVKMTYAARAGICGDGRSFIAEGTATGGGPDIWFANGVTVSGSMADIATRCTPGPVRLLLVVRDHRVIDVQPFVGPSSAATERAGTELGSVPVADITRYLIDLAKTGRDETTRSALLAASLADSVRIADQLATLARNKSSMPTIREAALKWVGRVAAREGNRDALRVARDIAEDRDDRLDVRERAIRVIGEEDGGAAYLRTLYARLDEPALRERVVRTMADVNDAESRRWLREIVERRSESSTIRERAIRSLAEQGDVGYLRSAYRNLEEENLRERVLRSAAESGGDETAAWLRGIVRDSAESSTLRERAVRLLGESGMPTADLAALYDSVPDRTVRERLVTVLAERGDRAARDKLRSIATDDPDEDLRRRATKKLTENR